MSEVEQKLRDELSIAPWEAIRVHAERDALICVSDDMDLVEVATAIAEDDVDNINSWMKAEKLMKPTAEKMKEWDEEPGKFFQFIIVQPYVVVAEYLAESQKLN